MRRPRQKQRGPFGERAPDQPRQLLGLPPLDGPQQGRDLQRRDAAPPHLPGRQPQADCRIDSGRRGMSNRNGRACHSRRRTPYPVAMRSTSGVTFWASPNREVSAAAPSTPSQSYSRCIVATGAPVSSSNVRTATRSGPNASRYGSELHRVVADVKILRFGPDRLGDRPALSMEADHVPVMADAAFDRIAHQVDEARIGVEGADPRGNAADQRTLRVTRARLAQQGRVAGLAGTAADSSPRCAIIPRSQASGHRRRNCLGSTK